MTSRTFGVFLCMAALLLGPSCAEVSRIATDPEGAIVYVNGMPVGETPVTYKYRSGLPETYYVKIEKEGYKAMKDITIDRTYRADLSLVLLILGIFPYFFSARLEPQYQFTLLPEKGTVRSETTIAP